MVQRRRSGGVVYHRSHIGIQWDRHAISTILCAKWLRRVLSRREYYPTFHSIIHDTTFHIFTFTFTFTFAATLAVSPVRHKYLQPIDQSAASWNRRRSYRCIHYSYRGIPIPSLVASISPVAQQTSTVHAVLRNGRLRDRIQYLQLWLGTVVCKYASYALSTTSVVLLDNNDMM